MLADEGVIQGVFHPHKRLGFLGEVLMQSIWVFCDASHTNWGMVFTVRPRKRMLTGVTDRGSEFTM